MSWGYGEDCHAAEDAQREAYDVRCEVDRLRDEVRELRRDLRECVADLFSVRAAIDDAVREHAETAQHLHADGSAS